MKILVLAPQPFYIDRGTPIDVDLVLRALSRRGEQLDVLTYHVGRDVSYPNVTLHRIPAPPRIRHVPPGLSVAKVVCDTYLLRAALRLARTHRYDLIHAGEESVFIALLCKALLGIPYVYDMDSSIAQQVIEKLPLLHPLSPLLNWCEARAIRGSIAAAPVCEALADLARSRGAPFVQTLHDISQLRTEDFHPEGLRTQLGITGPTVMYVGNLEPYQGIDLLLESTRIAMREHSGFDLIIAGGTDAAIAHYRERAQALHIAARTHFVGAWPADRLGTLLSEADILVSPRSRGINTPMKIFPYLHSGRPVLATELPTHTQILDRRIALMAPPEASAFAGGLLQLLNDPALRARLGAAGRDFVERSHTFDAYERRLNTLYDHVNRWLAGRGTARGSAP